MKKDKQQKAERSEIEFSNFCGRKGIECIKLDKKENKFLRKKFLINPDGDCPDFWCKKNNEEIFVEVKTLINIVKDETQKRMDEYVERVLKDKSGFVRIKIDPLKKEYEKRLENNLRSASKQFKNIKERYNYPKILLSANVVSSRFILNANFLGAYDSCSKNRKYVGLQKKERGFFDKTGSNVSALIYWSEENNCYNRIQNPKAKIEFTEDNFYLFFGI